MESDFGNFSNEVTANSSRVGLGYNYITLSDFADRSLTENK